jgi:RNA polymerase sigma-70 factor (sigma-E family)
MNRRRTQLGEVRTPASITQDVFVRHYEPLLRLAVLLTGSRETAEDVVQDVFSRALSRITDLPDSEQFPYLRAAVWNTWRNVLRRRAVERGHRSVASPVADDEAIEDRDAVWGAIKRLPVRQRACVVLRYYEGLTERETAEVLRCSVGTVKSQTSRALSHLRKELSDEDRG